MTREEIEWAAARMLGCCFTDREIALGGCRVRWWRLHKTVGRTPSVSFSRLETGVRHCRVSKPDTTSTVFLETGRYKSRETERHGLMCALRDYISEHTSTVLPMFKNWKKVTISKAGLHYFSINLLPCFQWQLLHDICWAQRWFSCRMGTQKLNTSTLRHFLRELTLMKITVEAN
jgi:hypothetical protein